MNIIRQASRLMMNRPRFRFSDSWKERDEAAEKVYITRK